MTRLLAFLLLCLLAGGHFILALRFNKLTAHAIYERWDASTNGTLLFEFKTKKRNGFLIYEDDPDGMDFIDIFLINGRVRMRLHIGQCNQQQEFINGNFSDNKWHRVRVFRAFESTHFKVDHHSSKIIKCGAKHSSFSAQSSLYVGGLPLDISLNSLAFPGSFYEIYNGNRFVGCISGVKYSDAHGHFRAAIMKNTSGTTADCKRECTRPYEFIMNCKHGERCGHKINDCDCLETGYEGQDCTRASTSVWLNGTGYIKYNLRRDNKNRTPLRNYIGFRFRTSLSDGVILHTSVERHFLVIELRSGDIVLKLDLGGGELVLPAGIGRRLSDNRWHWVEVKRRKRHATLILDGRVTRKGRVPGPESSSKLVLKGGKEVIYFGGGPSTADIGKSYSKRNFSGYLQQFRFDEYKILDKVMKDRKDKRFTKHGLVIDAKVLATVAIPTVTVKPTTPTWIGSSGDCPGSDDEDCVTKESVTTSTRSNESYPPSGGSENSTDSNIIYAHQQGSSASHGVPAWLITITVVAAVISIFITVFIVYRWNTRYSGSFSTASATPKADLPQPWPEAPSRTVPVITSITPVRDEHPSIYVTSYDKV